MNQDFGAARSSKLQIDRLILILQRLGLLFILVCEAHHVTQHVQVLFFSSFFFPVRLSRIVVRLRAVTCYTSTATFLFKFKRRHCQRLG